jgi:dihydropyrimidinase
MTTQLAEYDVAITGGQVAVPPLGIFPLTVAISGDRVAGLLDPDGPIRARRVVNASGKVVLPGLIDPHTHIGYEGIHGMPLDALPSQFESETASALIGGVTTLLNTYRNPAPYEEIFDRMRQAGEEHARIDFAYSLGVTNEQHLAGLRRYYEEFGVSSFKFYMAYRGEEARATGNVYNAYDDGLLFEAMETLAELPGSFPMIHPENIEVVARLRARLMAAGRNDLPAWTASRPAFVEAENVTRALYFGEQVGCPVYVVHVSSKKALDAALAHRVRRISPVHVETCIHYLTHTKDSELGVLAKVNPPLRDREDQEALWEGIAEGDVDTIGTDHCASLRAMKGPDLWSAAPGFSGMATMLPALLESVRHGRLSLLQVSMLTSYQVATIFNLYPRKGTLMVGSDADLTIIDLDLARRVTPEALKSRSDYSIFEGQTLRGWPTLTMVRGQVAMDNGEILAEPGRGQYLPRYGNAAGAPDASSLLVGAGSSASG